MLTGEGHCTIIFDAIMLYARAIREAGHQRRRALTAGSRSERGYESKRARLLEERERETLEDLLRTIREALDGATA